MVTSDQNPQKHLTYILQPAREIFPEILYITGPRQSGKTTALVEAIKRRINNGESCIVIGRTRASLDWITNLIKTDNAQEIKLCTRNSILFNNEAGIKLYQFHDSMQILGLNTSILHLFIDEPDHTEDYQDTWENEWKSITIARTEDGI